MAKSNVLAFPARHAREVTPASVLTGLQTQVAKGDISGLITFVRDANGNLTYAVTGAFSDRLQLASHVLVEALAGINDRIWQAGDAGRTSSPVLVESIAHRGAKANGSTGENGV